MIIKSLHQQKTMENLILVLMN
ncbi:hypothetical protein Golax_019313 [Gossypium laxum]|uniref:Uncharacterized protein n=1 Tax=Gossypium laxum TaxID=34288 RepID=A0A7J8Z7A8_9ROSI|nr:hypothetical protein [Gossypium laxum]